MGHLNRLLRGEKLGGKEQQFYWLWILATVTYGVGDMVTTITILEFDVGVEESNLLLKQIFDSLGKSGLIGFKILIFLIFLMVSLSAIEFWDDWPLYYLPPLILIAVGLIVTTNNLLLFLV